MEGCVELKFKDQLLQIHSAGKKSVLIKKDSHFNVIEEVKIASRSETKTNREYYVFAKVSNLTLLYLLSIYLESYTFFSFLNGFINIGVRYVVIYHELD